MVQCMGVCTYIWCVFVCVPHNLRVKFVAARDGLLPSFLCGVHNKYRTPLPAIVVSVSFSSYMYTAYIHVYA